MVFFESVHRIVDSLRDMAAILGDGRSAFVGRELTKLHEQCRQGTLAELSEAASSEEIPGKGEFVIVVSGSTEQETTGIDGDVLLTELADVLPPKQAAAIAAKVTGGKRNEYYKRILNLKDNL